jgi:hypothetical protein
MRFFASGFFHESVSPKPRTIPLGPFNIFRKFVEIFSAQGLPPVSLTPMAICHRRHWHQWRIWSLLLTQMSPLAGKPFQAIATMAYTRWPTWPSQKDLGCMGAPSFLHGAVSKSMFFCPVPSSQVWSRWAGVYFSGHDLPLYSYIPRGAVSPSPSSSCCKGR